MFVPLPFLPNLVLPATMKTALTVGALVGATFAAVNNKELLLEHTISAIDKGSNFLKRRLEQHKSQQMAHMEDAIYSGYIEDSDSYSYTDEDTTPDQSEWEDELEVDPLD